ncbi:hypothetical protein YB2330_005686 [Saitoella coloradoensis]
MNIAPNSGDVGLKQRIEKEEELPLHDFGGADKRDDDRWKPANKNKGRLSQRDRESIALLVALYLLQGIPLGLAFGSVPFILKSKLSYTQVGLFTLASYPYSLKLFWSPIVDAIYSPTYGRRKSWIVPMQTLVGLTLLLLGTRVEAWLDDAENMLGVLTAAFFSLIFLCATQDIAVDGWALTLLSRENLSYASTAQTVGLTAGYFTSFTVFLALNSPDLANKYWRDVPGTTGFVSLGGYLTFWGVVYLLVTAWLVWGKSEDPEPEGKDETGRGGVVSAYGSMWAVLRLPHIQHLLVVHLLSKFAFSPNEAATNLKLLERGFPASDLALTALIDFPFEVMFGYLAARWSQGPAPLKPWMYGFIGRLGSAVLAMLVVSGFPSGGVGYGYFLAVMAGHVVTQFMSTVQMVSICAFHTGIADPRIGGTYMTLLNTLSNLGGTWPRFFILRGIDYFTVASCVVGGVPTAIAHSATSQLAKDECKELGGSVVVDRDGYYVMSSVCVALGALVFFGWTRPAVKRLERLPKDAWRIGRSGGGD